MLKSITVGLFSLKRKKRYEKRRPLVSLQLLTYVLIYTCILARSMNTKYMHLKSVLPASKQPHQYLLFICFPIKKSYFYI